MIIQGNADLTRLGLYHEAMTQCFKFHYYDRNSRTTIMEAFFTVLEKYRADHCHAPTGGEKWDRR